MCHQTSTPTPKLGATLRSAIDRIEEEEAYAVVDKVLSSNEFRCLSYRAPGPCSEPGEVHLIRVYTNLYVWDVFYSKPDPDVSRLVTLCCGIQQGLRHPSKGPGPVVFDIWVEDIPDHRAYTYIGALDVLLRVVFRLILHLGSDVRALYWPVPRVDGTLANYRGRNLVSAYWEREVSLDGQRRCAQGVVHPDHFDVSGHCRCSPDVDLHLPLMRAWGLSSHV